MEVNPANGPYKIFLSYKHTAGGELTPDMEMAQELYRALDALGIRTFFSQESIGVTGVSKYKEAIDAALDECCILVAVGTSAEHLSSGWVRYEWDSFAGDILSGCKKGKLFSYIDKMTPAELPRTLRQVQSFEKKRISPEEIAVILQNALGKDASVLSPAQPAAVPEPPAPAAPQPPAPPSPKPDHSQAVSRMMQFADAVASNMAQSGYVLPYLSEEMMDIAATHAAQVTPYTAEKLLAENRDPAVYEVFLAQKIARINDPASCVNAFQLLREMIDCWTVFLNEEGKVAAYWMFIALQEEAFERIKTGQVDEKDIRIEDVRFIDMPDRYKGYLLIAGTIAECRTRTVVSRLYDSWLGWLEELARDGIFFDEISSMVGSPAGNSSLRGIGMEYYADYAFGGRMYRYDMRRIGPAHYLARRFPELTRLYREEYGEENAACNTD